MTLTQVVMLLGGTNLDMDMHTTTTGSTNTNTSTSTSISSLWWCPVVRIVLYWLGWVW